jgi:hypothetical protein
MDRYLEVSIVSGCNVCIGGWDGEAADFYVEQIVTARKPHKCYECSTVVVPGQKYERVTGKWDGELGRYTFCLFCSEVSKVFSCGDGRMFGVLWEDMTEYAFPNLTTASPCFLALSPESKAKLLDKWRKWKFN